MIHYNLKCENNHAFSSWFDSLEAFDKLEKLICYHARLVVQMT